MASSRPQEEKRKAIEAIVYTTLQKTAPYDISVVNAIKELKELVKWKTAGLDKQTRKTIGEVVVIGVKGNQARLGFEFGSEYVLVRNEIADGSNFAKTQDKYTRSTDIDGNR